jgi:hypothetical protein
VDTPEPPEKPTPPEAEAPTPPTKVCPNCGVQSQTFADKCPSCGKPYKKKRGGCLKWAGISVLVLVVLIAGCSALVASDDSGDDETTTPAATEASPAPTEEDAPEESEPAEPEPEEAGFGDGTHRVGDDIAAGTYRSDGDSTCYWARLAGFSAELDDIKANGNSAPEIVAIAASDAGFEARGCGRWVDVSETAPAAPAAEFGDGTYGVGTHIEPGTYRADGSGTCYWARLSDFSHELDGIITNGNSPTTIEIAASDAGFTTRGCGTWTK